MRIEKMELSYCCCYIVIAITNSIAWPSAIANDAAVHIFTVNVSCSYCCNCHCHSELARENREDGTFIWLLLLYSYCY